MSTQREHDEVMPGLPGYLTKGGMGMCVEDPVHIPIDSRSLEWYEEKVLKKKKS